MYDNNIYSTVEPEPIPERVQEQPKAKKGGGFKKVMMSICMGLLFGMFAGLGFFVVGKTTGALPSKETESTKQENVQESAQITEPAQIQGNEANEFGLTTLPNDDTQTQVATTMDTSAYNINSVVQKVMPSMVSITEYYTATGYSFWGESYSENGSASGSGILIGETDTEYLIVTNNHVIEGAESLEVTFVNDEVVSADVKGTDSSKDLAIIAVQKSNVDDATRSAISIATLGDSDALVLGEDVVAIGNALGYGQSVTNGIVSALNREITTEDGVTNTFIQTNAAINPGNSGGALLNMNGEVVGINSNKIGDTAVEGMGYAIPISSVKDIIAELSEHETMIRVAEDEVGYIGISLQEINSTMAERYNMPQGIYIVETSDGGAAQAAGLHTGDIITGLAGNKIGSYAELQNIMQYYAAGTTVEITYMRQVDGVYQENTVSLTLGRKPIQSR